MADKRILAAGEEKKWIFENTWNAAITFEAAFAASDKNDWYNEARIVRGGYATSQLSSDFLENYVAFMVNYFPIRGSSKRRAMKVDTFQEVFSQQRKVISSAVATWEQRSRELEVTLPVEREDTKIAHYADAELRDLVLHLKNGKLNRGEFDSKIEDALERWKMTSTDLTDWKTSQDIQF